ncbi:hypothetical protein HELRODRAFT_180604 [Helobdella robusta]|uniref:Ig-like domain-containing protein n=1 Tax=Helobdella robusta TaxID=6412 RepID=T1FG31_HELRO|nr:hypothetical protein HELRODRAFT_180604 [Helobdella robusta]ESN93738.1 hypothetical protein HELRODRAFT_180604 [Helobdella robusta]
MASITLCHVRFSSQKLAGNVVYSDADDADDDDDAADVDDVILEEDDDDEDYFRDDDDVDEGVTETDSGNYSCEVRGKKSMVLGRVTHNLIVLYKPTMLKCVSHGAYPAPAMSIVHGGKNVSEMFRRNTTLEYSGPKDMRLLTYKSTIWRSNFVANSHDDGTLIQCVASHKTLEATTTNVTLVVYYQPEIDCDGPTYARMGEKNATMVCHVRARPEIYTIHCNNNKYDGIYASGKNSHSKYNATSYIIDGGDNNRYSNASSRAADRVSEDGGHRDNNININNNINNNINISINKNIDNNINKNNNDNYNNDNINNNIRTCRTTCSP